jgi:DNA-binding MarR family transcriptional regulator
LKQLLAARRARDTFFGPNLFDDPAWDILLQAYAARLDQERLSVTALCLASAVPSTTALRWLNKLEQDGWLSRRSDPLDARRSWIELSDIGNATMERYWSAVWRSLPPA